MTLFANSPGALSLVLLFPTALLMLVPRRESGTPLPSTSRTSSPNRTQYAPTPPHSQQSPIIQLSALTTYRAHMILMTVLSILAVDFPVFPRSLAKCETYGVSLVGPLQYFHSMASSTVLGSVDGPRCGIIRIFARGGFRNTNYQVSGSSLFSIKTKGCKGSTEIPTNLGAGVPTTHRRETVRLSRELVSHSNLARDAHGGYFRNTRPSMAPTGIFSLRWAHSPYSKSSCIPSCHSPPFR